MKIVFDLDGTLYLTEKSVFRAFAATVEGVGLWYLEQALERASIRDVPQCGQQLLQRYITKYIPIQKRYAV